MHKEVLERKAMPFLNTALAAGYRVEKMLNLFIEHGNHESMSLLSDTRISLMLVSIQECKNLLDILSNNIASVAVNDSYSDEP